jgi:lysophospholipase L1-like esterase
MNIVLFGDSHLGRFGKLLCEQLEGLVEESTVYNCSAGGFTSADGAKRADYIAKLNPDVVVFSYAGNDVAPWKDVVPKEAYLQNMRKIFNAFPNSKKVLFTSADVAVADSAQAHEYNSALHAYREALAPICEELSVFIVDGGKAVSSLGKDCHVEDGVHMNDEAYAKVVEALAAAINSL